MTGPGREAATGATMEVAQCRQRFAAAEHAYLATSGADRVPHLVPVVFALEGDEIAVVVDHKPKRTTALRRLRNIRENPRVCFLVDDYSPDWDRLWWVRADALAEVVDDGPRRDRAVERLISRYPPYLDPVPTGPVILARVERWSGWSAAAR